MATYQQRIALKGSESTIADFTNLLREVKDLFGINSAEVITNAIKHWREHGYKTLQDKNLSLNLVTKYFSESCTYNTRIFHLQLLTSADIMSSIQADVDRLKRDPTLKSAIEMYGIGPYSRGGADFQLAALILVLEYYKLSSPSKTTKAYTDLNNAKKPPIPINPAGTTKPYVSSDKQSTPSFLQSKSDSPFRISETHSLNLRIENSIPSSVSGHHRNQMSTEREEHLTLFEPRYRRGQSCVNYGLNNSTNIDENEKSRHLVSWRTRIREQQLAENRRLNDSIRSALSSSRETTPVNKIDLEEKIKGFRNRRSNTPSISNVNSWRNNLNIYDRAPITRLDNEKVLNPSQNILSELNANRSSIKRTINYDQPPPEWTLIHQTDIRKRAFGLSTSTNSASKHNVNADAKRNMNISYNNINSDNKENSSSYLNGKDSPLIKRRYEIDSNKNDNILKCRQASEPPKTLPKLNSSISTSGSLKGNEAPAFKLNIDLDILSDLVLSLKERKSRSEKVTSGYLMVEPPDKRQVPGFPDPLTNGERMRNGIDCDEVFPNIVLGNGATLRKKDYLKEIGISYILNAAESRGVNVGKEYFGDDFQYMGLKIEDTPQTQICR